MTRRFEHLLLIALLAALTALIVGLAAPAPAPAASPSSAAKQTTTAAPRAARIAPQKTAADKCGSPSKSGSGSVRAAMVTPLAVSAMSAACAKSASLVDDITGLPGKAVDGAVGLVGDAVESVASSVGGSMMDQVAGWMGKQSAGLVKSVMEKVRKSTSPHVDGPKAKWFKTQYLWMMGLAAFLSGLVVIFAVLSGALSANWKEMAQTAFINWPMAFFFMGAALGITQMSLDLTDEFCKQVISATGNDMRTVFTTIAGSLGADGKANVLVAAPGGGLLVMVTSLIALMGSLLIWVELIMREAAVYLVMFFFPLGMAISIWPKFKRTRNRAITLLAVAVVSKFFILAIFGFGAAMIASGTTDDVTRILAGVFVMFVAAMTPTLLMAFLPFDEIGGAFGQRPRMPQGAQLAAKNGMSKMLSTRPGGGGADGGASPGNNLGPGGGGGGGGGGDVPTTSGRGGGGGIAKPAGSGGGSVAGATGSAEGAGGGAAIGGGALAGAAAAPLIGVAAGGAMAAKRGLQQAGPAMEGAAAEAGLIAGNAPDGGPSTAPASSPAATPTTPPTDIATTSGGSAPGAPAGGPSNGAAPPPHIAARQTSGANVTAAEGGIPVA